MPRYDITCPQGHELIDYVKSINDPYPTCPQCGEQTERLWTASGGIIGDAIPGGVLISHGAGMINPDGTPKRYYSKTDIKRAMNESGWVWSGDTPGKSYKVNWSGRRKTNAGFRATHEDQ